MKTKLTLLIAVILMTTACTKKVTEPVYITKTDTVRVTKTVIDTVRVNTTPPSIMGQWNFYEYDGYDANGKLTSTQPLTGATMTFTLSQVTINPGSAGGPTNTYSSTYGNNYVTVVYGGGNPNITYIETVINNNTGFKLTWYNGALIAGVYYLKP